MGIARIAVLALVLTITAGCGSDSSGSAATSTPPPAVTEAATTPAPDKSGGTAAESGVVEITMNNKKFEPATADVKVGETVTWTDIEDVPHNVVATGGETFKSEIFGKGESFSWTATKPGKVDYVCTLHPGMIGTLNVTE